MSAICQRKAYPALTNAFSIALDSSGTSDDFWPKFIAACFEGTFKVMWKRWKVTAKCCGSAVLPAQFVGM